MSLDDLTLFQADPAKFMEGFLAKDEHWVHRFEPETNRQSMQCIHPFHPSKESQGGLVSRKGDGFCLLLRQGHNLH